MDGRDRDLGCFQVGFVCGSDRILGVSGECWMDGGCGVVWCGVAGEMELKVLT